MKVYSDESFLKKRRKNKKFIGYKEQYGGDDNLIQVRILLYIIAPLLLILHFCFAG